MKTIQKVVFVISILLLAVNSYAGRWLSRDPIEQMERDPKPTMPSNLNLGKSARPSLIEINSKSLYTFVDNNPINEVDPLGLWQITIGGGVGGGGLITFGNNGGSNWHNGQWNVGAYGGAGEGLFGSFDPTNHKKDCSETPGLHGHGGIYGEGEIGDFEDFSLNASSNIGLFNSDNSWDIGIDVPMSGGTIGGSYGSEGATFPVFGGGAGGVVGIGGSLTW